jgi:hypothetical protein
MAKAVYQWKPRTDFGIDAQVAGEELEKIRGHNSGDLTPEMVITAATSKKSPLHSLFEWDDAKAGHQYRLQQAGLLIRSVVVTIVGDGPTRSGPLKVNVRRQPSRGGTAAAKVIPPEELHRQRVERGWSELEEWHMKYAVLSEFAGVAAALHGFLMTRHKASEAA